MAAVLGVCLALPREAHAGRGIIIYNSGHDVFPAGPLPDPYAGHPQLSGAQAGFRCSIFGLFWAYFHIWDCQPVAVKGDTYFSDPALSKAIGARYAQSDMKVGLWPKHGRWLFGFAVLALGVMFVLGRGKAREEADAGESAATT